MLFFERSRGRPILCRRCAMIGEFQNECRFLSNFWPARVRLDGVEYPTVEHAYQAAKTLVLCERETIRAQETPGKAKRAGRRISLRPDWEQVKIGVMRDLLRQKFAPGTELAQKLLETGSEGIAEGNHWHDGFWGDCQCGRCPRGQNWLGRLLMGIRAELRGGA